MIVFSRFLVILFACFTLSISASAQDGQQNALQGFAQNRDQPVQIDAAELEVREKEQLAIFSGDVNIVQGDTRMTASKLTVYYEPSASGTPETTGSTSQVNAPGFSGAQQIRQLVAEGDVNVFQNEQKASGKRGVFDMRSNTVTLDGGVVFTQGQNVLRGQRLVVNLDSGVSRIESGSSSGNGRVQGLFLPSQANQPNQ